MGSEDLVLSRRQLACLDQLAFTLSLQIMRVLVAEDRASVLNAVVDLYGTRYGLVWLCNRVR